MEQSPLLLPVAWEQICDVFYSYVKGHNSAEARPHAIFLRIGDYCGSSDPDVNSSLVSQARDRRRYAADARRLNYSLLRTRFTPIETTPLTVAPQLQRQECRKLPACARGAAAARPPADRR